MMHRHPDDDRRMTLHSQSITDMMKSSRNRSFARGSMLWAALMVVVLSGLVASGCRRISPDEPDTPGGTSMIQPSSAGIISVRAISSLGDAGDFELDLFVTDSNGNIITNLPSDALTMLSGLDTSFISTGCTPSTLPSCGPFSAEVLLDQSNSMEWNDPYDLRLKAASVFMNGVSLVGGGNEAQLSSFFNFASGGLRTYGPFTTDAQSFDPAISSLANNLGPATPLYDAMYEMSDSLALLSHNANKVLIVLTDGEDNDSYHSLFEAIDHAKANGVKVFAVALKTGLLADSTAAKGSDAALFSAAMQTGGAAMHTSDPAVAVPYYASLSKVLQGGTGYYKTTWHVKTNGGSLAGQEFKAKLKIAGKNGTSVIAPFVVKF